MFTRGDAYERFMGRWSQKLAPTMVAFSEIKDGDAVLDIGSGTGALALTIRDMTSATRVTGVDPSAELVTYAATKSDARVQFVVGNAEQLPFPNAAFDKTVSLLVINFIPDRARALSEMQRVTKPGGTVSAAVWDYSEGMQMLRVFWDEATALDRASEARDEARMPLCREGELGALCREQGLASVQEAALTIPLHFESFDDYWAPFLLGHGPAGAYIAGLSKESQAALEQRLRSRLVGAGSDHAFDLQARAWVVKGTVP